MGRSVSHVRDIRQIATVPIMSVTRMIIYAVTVVGLFNVIIFVDDIIV